MALIREFSNGADIGPGILSGDTDCSGAVNSVDALRLLRLVAQLNEADTCLNVAGDVDCGGDKSSVDALDVLRHVAGLPLTLPSGCPQPGETVIT